MQKPEREELISTSPISATSKSSHPSWRKAAALKSWNTTAFHRLPRLPMM
jgi:hypothetical protein